MWGELASHKRLFNPPPQFSRLGILVSLRPIFLCIINLLCVMYMYIHVCVPLFVWVGITFLPLYLYSLASVLCTCISMYIAMHSTLNIQYFEVLSMHDRLRQKRLKSGKTFQCIYCLVPMDIHCPHVRIRTSIDWTRLWLRIQITRRFSGRLRRVFESWGSHKNNTCTCMHMARHIHGIFSITV